MKPYYQDDVATIYHGDCRDVVDAVGFHALVTDPPYIGREDLFCTAAVAQVIPKTLARASGGAVVFWSALVPLPVEQSPTAIHVWHKSVPIHPKSVTGNVAGHQYERIFEFGGKAKCEVFRVAAVMPGFAACRDELTEHPTQKPLVLMRQLVDRTRGTVLDPFMGSGTTLRAAKDAGRKCIGVEIEERYCEIAAKRLAQEVLDFGAAS